MAACLRRPHALRIPHAVGPTGQTWSKHPSHYTTRTIEPARDASLVKYAMMRWGAKQRNKGRLHASQPDDQLQHVHGDLPKLV